MSRVRQAWPPARIALLEQLWRDGVTALQISEHLGTTRNAVIGKLNRLKLLKIERARPVKLPALPKSVMRLPMKNIPIQALTPRSCRWIEADPKHVTVVLYCGERTVIGSAWCPSHYRRVYPRSSLEVAA